MKPLTEKQWWEISNNTNPPQTLKENIPDSFVYDREYGLFPVQYGCHNSVMAKLLAFHNSCDNYFDLAKKRGIKMEIITVDEFADEFICLEGTAFLSSVGTKIVVNNLANLSKMEQRIFTNAGYKFSEIHLNLL